MREFTALLRESLPTFQQLPLRIFSSVNSIQHSIHLTVWDDIIILASHRVCWVDAKSKVFVSVLITNLLTTLITLVLTWPSIRTAWVQRHHYDYSHVPRFFLDSYNWWNFAPTIFWEVFLRKLTDACPDVSKMAGRGVKCSQDVIDYAQLDRFSSADTELCVFLYYIHV